MPVENAQFKHSSFSNTAIGSEKSLPD